MKKVFFILFYMFLLNISTIVKADIKINFPYSFTQNKIINKEVDKKIFNIVKKIKKNYQVYVFDNPLLEMDINLNNESKKLDFYSHDYLVNYVMKVSDKNNKCRLELGYINNNLYSVSMFFERIGNELTKQKMINNIFNSVGFNIKYTDLPKQNSHIGSIIHSYIAYTKNIDNGYYEVKLLGLTQLMAKSPNFEVIQKDLEKIIKKKIDKKDFIQATFIINNVISKDKILYNKYFFSKKGILNKINHGYFKLVFNNKNKTELNRELIISVPFDNSKNIIAYRVENINSQSLIKNDIIKKDIKSIFGKIKKIDFNKKEIILSSNIKLKIDIIKNRKYEYISIYES